MLRVSAAFFFVFNSSLRPIQDTSKQDQDLIQQSLNHIHPQNILDVRERKLLKKNDGKSSIFREHWYPWEHMSKNL